MDVHLFDGCLPVSELETERETEPKSETEVSDPKLECLRESRKFFSGNGLKYFDMIVKSYEKFGETHVSANYDPSNKLFADEMLYQICKYIISVQDDEIKNTFVFATQIQLEDMATGFCPQGRCTRLFQILYSIDRTKK